MFDNLSETGRAAVFYAIAFGLAAIAALFAPTLGEGALMLMMLTPTAAALVMVLLVTREGRSRGAWAGLGLTRAGWSGWPLAILAPTVLLSVAYVILWATDFGDYQPTNDGRPVPAIVVSSFVGLLIGIVMALGEEIGWRGFMLPRLLPLGVVPAMLIVGFCHGVWHMPAILLTPYYHADGNLLIVVPLFLITLTLAGIFFGYLRIVTGSVWPVAIAHAVHNDVWAFFAERTTGPSPEMIEYLGGESGVIEIAGLAVLAAILLRLLRGRRFPAAAPA